MYICPIVNQLMFMRSILSEFVFMLVREQFTSSDLTDSQLIEEVNKKIKTKLLNFECVEQEPRGSSV